MKEATVFAVDAVVFAGALAIMLAVAIAMGAQTI